MYLLFFIKFLFITKWWSFKNDEKCFLFHLKGSFCSPDIQIFVFLSSPVFFPAVSHCLRGWSKKNLKVYGVINYPSKNLRTHFVWYCESDTETLSIDRELSKEHFSRKNHTENVNQRLALNPFLILLNNPKQPLHARNSFKNKAFWKSIVKKYYFFFWTQSLLMDKVIKHKRGLELVTSRSSGRKTNSEKFLYLLYIIWPILMK